MPSIGAGISLVVGDFDGDGRSHVVVPTTGRPGAVTVLLGSAAGVLQPAVFTPLPSNGAVLSAAAAHLDGDGLLDLVAGTISDAGPAITILLGRGDGTFDVGGPVAATGGAVIGVAAGDVDGDGSIDYVAAVKSLASGSVIQVALGRGDGTFEAPSSYPPGIYISPSDFDLVDVDADGAPDLVYLQGCPTVRLNAGDGTFGPQICSTDPSGRIGGVAQVVADLDEDGLVDLATGDASGGHVTVSLGDGAGRFTFFKQYDVGGNQVNSITVGDFTGDGHLDLVAAADAYFAAPTRVTVQLRGSGNGTFPKRTYYATGGDGVAPIELNGNAKLDLAATGLTAGTVSSVINKGRGRFSAPHAYKSNAVTAVSSIVRTADVNGDALADVLTVAAGTVYVRLRDTKGRPGSPQGVAGKRRHSQHRHQ